MCSCVLTDPEFGLESLSHVKQSGIMLSIDASPYGKYEQDDMPLLYPDWGVQQIVERDAIPKLFIYYNPESKNAEQKKELCERYFLEAQVKHVPFLLEPILNILPTQSKEEFQSRYMELTTRMIKDLSQHCDVFKIEFPLAPGEVFDEQVTAQRCRSITSTIHVPWILLTRGVGYEQFLLGLVIAMRNGASGFAAGRAVWKEIGEFATWEEQERFVRTVSADRMHQLIRVVEKA